MKIVIPCVLTTIGLLDKKRYGFQTEYIHDK